MRFARKRHTRSLALPFAALAASLVLGPGGCENFDVRNLTPPLEDDSPLALSVRDALAESPITANSTINVKTLNPGTIRLSGQVDTDTISYQAENIASRVAGVDNVVNTLFIDD